MCLGGRKSELLRGPLSRSRLSLQAAEFRISSCAIAVRIGVVGCLNVLSDLELYEGFEASLEVGGGIWYSVERVSEIGIRDNDSSTQCALAVPEVRYFFPWGLAGMEVAYHPLCVEGFTMALPVHD